MTIDIGRVFIDPPVALAPMAGFTTCRFVACGGVFGEGLVGQSMDWSLSPEMYS